MRTEIFLVTWEQGPQWDIATVLIQWPQWEGARVPSPTQRDACGSQRSGVLCSTGPDRPQSLDSDVLDTARASGRFKDVLRFSNKFNV